MLRVLGFRILLEFSDVRVVGCRVVGFRISGC